MKSPGLLLVASVVFAVTGCQTQKDAPVVVNRPLPPPPSGELTYAGAPPSHPFAKQAGNHFARTVFETDGPSNSRVEVRDVLIAPHLKGTVDALPGPAVIDPAGAPDVTVSVGDEQKGGQEGVLRSLPAGQALRFENSGSRPAMIRLYILRSR